MNRRSISKLAVSLGLMLLLACSLASTTNGQVASDTFSLCIKEIDIENPDNGILGLNPSFDAKVSWQCLKNGIRAVPPESAGVSQFRVLYANREDNLLTDPAKLRIVSEKYAIFEDLDPEDEHWFFVEGLNAGHRSVLRTAGTLLEFHKVEAALEEKSTTAFLATGWRTFVDASLPGLVAFICLFICMVIGLIVWLLRSGPYLQSSQLFPHKKVLDGEMMLADDKDFLKTLMASGGDRSGDAISEEKLKELLVLNATVQNFRGKTSLLFRLIWRLMSLPNTVVQLFRRRLRTTDLPTFKIAKAGLKAASRDDDVGEMIDARIHTEMNSLRKRSFIDALWAIGVLAPLLGLFGTVTGLSYSFAELSAENINTKEILTSLAGGINEALFTTILGLLIGVGAVATYYYYSYKLDRALSMWQIFGAEFADATHPANRTSTSATSGPGGASAAQSS